MNPLLSRGSCNRKYLSLLVLILRVFVIIDYSNTPSMYIAKLNAKKRIISNKTVTVLKARGKPTLVDVNCHCKMTSVMVLDGVISF